MERVSEMLQKLTGLFVRVIEMGFALVGILVLLYILMGEAAGSLATGTVANLLLLVAAATPAGLVGIAIVAALMWFYSKRGA